MRCCVTFRSVPSSRPRGVIVAVLLPQRPHMFIAKSACELVSIIHMLMDLSCSLFAHF
ncbi:Hypothetical protein, putative [Bodo saltans]|uniref:Uncharacterized protein n=1 Tax=Bodo saltans TaxID=75058 RepID=A0A0S4ISE4_BODSA|nr:Hypothetical protein, putative [Bodo saltans]|eukprot:CUF56638.1 Hypothetical protein, putative [Bodo saltans]